MTSQANPTGAASSNNAPSAVVDWDPEPTKTAMKTAYGVYNTAFAGAIKAPLASAASQYYPSVPEPVIKLAVEAGVAKAAEESKKIYNKTVDNAYASPDALGSRVVRYYKDP